MSVDAINFLKSHVSPEALKAADAPKLLVCRKHIVKG